MGEATKKLYVLHGLIGPKLVDKKQRAKLLAKGDGVWQQKTARFYRKHYSINHGNAHVIISVLACILVLLAFLDVAGVSLLGVSWSNYPANLFVYFMVFFCLISTLTRSSQNKAIKSINESKREVFFEEDSLIIKEGGSKIELGIDQCNDMVDTRFGFILYFENNQVPYFFIIGTEEYNRLYTELKNSITDGVYKMIAI